jgi:hypothetical protein
MDEFNKYMAEITAKREAFDKEMTAPLLAYLKERYGPYRVSDGYVYITLPEDHPLGDFLEGVAPYLTVNEVKHCQGRVGIRLRFC